MARRRVKGLRPGEVLIGRDNWRDFLSGAEGSDGRRTGLAPRDLTRHPRGMLAFAPPWSLPVISDPKEQQERLAEQTAKKQLLSDLRAVSGPNGGSFPSRDQNGKGYCWAHSSVSAMLYARAAAGEPYADLSAYAVACIIKGYRDEGGWGSESMEFISSRGVPTAQFWAQQSMSQANDKPETWANAALHKWTNWMELAQDRATKVNQLITACLLGLPVVSDFNWWSHSVCTIDIVSVSPLRTRIQNSWGDSWSDKGMGTLDYPKSVPDDAWVAVVGTPSLA